jgi:hypothetical protein
MATLSRRILAQGEFSAGISMQELPQLLLFIRVRWTTLLNLQRRYIEVDNAQRTAGEWQSQNIKHWHNPLAYISIDIRGCDELPAEYMT